MIKIVMIIVLVTAGHSSGNKLNSGEEEHHDNQDFRNHQHDPQDIIRQDKQLDLEEPVILDNSIIPGINDIESQIFGSQSVEDPYLAVPSETQPTFAQAAGNSYNYPEDTFASNPIAESYLAAAESQADLAAAPAANSYLAAVPESPTQFAAPESFGYPAAAESPADFAAADSYQDADTAVSAPDSYLPALDLSGAADQPSSDSIDFTGAEPVVQPDGSVKYCVEKLETREELKKDPVLECVHKTIEKCHYTYKTTFVPVQEEVCEDNYVKHCNIMYKKIAMNETYTHCYKPLIKDCSTAQDESEENQICKEYYESSCTTKYIEKSPGKFVGDTSCEKIPVKLCGDSKCRMVEGPQECHDKVTVSIVDQPEEHCELTPQKSCRHKTTLVPRLKAVPECTLVPREVCHIKYENSRIETVPFTSLWCQDQPQQEVITNQLTEGFTTEPPTTTEDLYDEVTSTPQDDIGYNYDVPENQLNPTRPSNNQQPIEDIDLAVPAPILPPTPPVNKQVVGLRPEDLELAVTEAVRQAVTEAVNRATVLADTLESKARLKTAVMLAVETAVQQALMDAVTKQTTSNQPQSAMNLQAAIRKAITLAVETSVRKALANNKTVMTSNMESELKNMEVSIQEALLQAIRKAVKQAVKNKLTSSTESNTNSSSKKTTSTTATITNSSQGVAAPNPEALRRAVLAAVQRTVQLAIQRRSQTDSQATKIAIQQAVNQAVAIAVTNTLARDKLNNPEATTAMSNTVLRNTVENNIMKSVRNALRQVTSKTRTTEGQRASLAAALQSAVKVAIQNSIRNRLN